MSSNFTNQGNLYKDGISCDPALFFLSPDVSHLTDVSLWKDPPDDFSLRIIPHNLTMLNLTFGWLRIAAPVLLALHRPSRLQSLAVRNARDGQYVLSMLRSFAMNELLILDFSYNNIDTLSRHMFHQMYNLTVILLNGNQIYSISQYTFCGNSLPMLHSVNLVDALTNIPEDIFSIPERDCNAVYKCDLTNLKFLRLSIVGTRASHFEGILEPFAFSRLRGMNELQLCGGGITGIDVDTFACLTEVRTLWLSDSKIQNLKLQTFSHLTNLQHLLLNNNSLNSISATIFSIKSPTHRSQCFNQHDREA